MGQILVRKIDDAVLERLKLLAKERNMPVEALARNALEEIANRRTDAETRQWLANMERIRRMSPPSNEDSVPLLRKLREDHEFDG